MIRLALKKTVVQKSGFGFAEFPAMAFDLIKNPVFTSMVIGWMFGSYLTGGYSTYLPKYIETQFGRSASVADMYSGKKIHCYAVLFK